MALTDREAADLRKEDVVSNAYQTLARYKQSNKHQPVRLAAFTLLALVLLSGALVGADPNPSWNPSPADPNDWAQIVNQFDLTHAAYMNNTYARSLPGIGKIQPGLWPDEGLLGADGNGCTSSDTCANRMPCDFYPSQTLLETWLSAYLVTHNEKFRSNVERQLAYAHSLENEDRLLARYASDGADRARARCMPGEVSRDSQARQIYGFYLAWRALKNPLYLRWAEASAAGLRRAPRGTPGLAYLAQIGPFRGFPSGLPPVFGASYVRTDGQDLWAGSGATYAPDHPYDIDVNQNAELALSYWLLVSDPTSIFYGDPSIRQIAIDEMRAAVGLQVTDASATYFATTSNCHDDVCVQPRTGAISLAQDGHLWDWDETYGVFAAWSVSMALALGMAPPDATWQLFVNGAKAWLYPVSTTLGSDGLFETIRYYKSTGTHPATWVERTDPADAWQFRAPVFLAADRGSGCTAGSDLRRMLDTMRASSDDRMRLGGATAYLFFWLSGLPRSCILPPDPQPPQATDGITVFLKRGVYQVEKLTTLANDAGHSLWLGEQTFISPVVAVVQMPSYVYVALNVTSGGTTAGRVVKYLAGTSGETMFNVAGDGITQLPMWSTQMVGYQDYARPITALAADDANVWVGLKLPSGGRLVRYQLGSSGASMFNVLSDGVTHIAPYSQQVIGYQDFTPTVAAVSSNGAQVYVGLGNWRVVRYEVAVAGTGGTMFYAAPTGVAAVSSMWQSRFDAEVMGYQDFDRSISALVAEVDALYVGLAATSERGGRVVRYRHPRSGSGSSMYYADTTGVQALPAWVAAFDALLVGYQDYTSSVVDLVTRGGHAYVTTDGNRIGRDPMSLTWFIKYFAGDHTGASMWLVDPDGVTRSFDCRFDVHSTVACTRNTETVTDSMIEVTHRASGT